jgi:hypothetical protein
MENKVKALALSGIVVASALAGAAVHTMVAEPVTVEKLVPVEKIVTVDKEVKVEVPVEKIVEKTVTVEDEAFKALACDRLLFDDIKECVEEVKAEDAALKLAIAEIKSEFAEELEDADLVEDERDASIVKLYTSYEDLTVEDSDFDNDEYTFVVKAKINDEEAEEKSYVNFTVDVRDGEAKIVDVEAI